MSKPLDTSKMEGILSAEEILKDAISMEYETVIVFGYKDGDIYTRHSDAHGALEVIGALEVAKRLMWEMPS
jgi:hypothetical protein